MPSLNNIGIPTPSTDQLLTGQKVVISGGGIGGASAALALSLRGAEVDLFEKTREFKEVGAGLQLGPHGLKLLGGWGVLDTAIEQGYLPKRMQFRDAITGEAILTIPFDEDFVSRYGERYLVIHRSDLLTLLIEAAKENGARFHAGHIVEDAQNVADGVSVTVRKRADHSISEVHADVFLAFDGSHSTFRKRFVNDQPVASAFVAYRGTSSLPDDPVMCDLDEVRGYIGPHCHFIQYPLRHGELLNQVAVFESPRYLAGVETGTVPDDWGNPEELDHAFDHVHESIQERLHLMWRDTWWQMADVNPAPRWVDGNISILGDAAHAPLQYIASGAIMAMGDAEAVATYAAEAAREKSLWTWEEVLKEVEAERLPRTRRIQTTSRFWGEVWHLDGLPRLIRNQMFRDAEAGGKWHKYADWLWAYDVSKHEYARNPQLGELPKALREFSYSIPQV